MGFAPTSFAQGLDLITTVNGESFISDTQTRYFNQANCDNPAAVTFEERIATDLGTTVSQVYLWAGGQNSQCEIETNRTDITGDRCQPVADGAAQTVDPNNLISNLTLGDLVDTGLVDCSNTALQGQPYELYGFRNEPPGSVTVPPEGFGIAAFVVDVTPPDPPNVTNDTDTPALGQSFVLEWSQPTDDIQLYRFYQNDLDDPVTAQIIEGVTGAQNATSQGFTATQLGLGLGDSAYLYATAVDMASVVLGEGNEGDKSVGWKVEAAETSGFCDATGTCTGCSVSPMTLAGGEPGSITWIFGLGFAVFFGWRLRR